MAAVFPSNAATRESRCSVLLAASDSCRESLCSNASSRAANEPSPMCDPGASSTCSALAAVDAAAASATASRSSNLASCARSAAALSSSSPLESDTAACPCAVAACPCAVTCALCCARPSSGAACPSASPNLSACSTPRVHALARALPSRVRRAASLASPSQCSARCRRRRSTASLATYAAATPTAQPVTVAAPMKTPRPNETLICRSVLYTSSCGMRASDEPGPHHAPPPSPAAPTIAHNVPPGAELLFVGDSASARARFEEVRGRERDRTRAADWLFPPPTTPVPCLPFCLNV
mmetsp:Transcript_10453/g.32581  ORF Transcript_10453/g.32581 Transcript_10453/m.32581 type:complete len:295 (+) Transcript_10453:51-935(+)